jgi:ADP-ribose pyrophosphatase
MTPAPVFVAGILAHSPLLSIILGREPAGQAAVLPDHMLFRSDGSPDTPVVAAAGQRVAGVLLTGLGGDERDRLIYHAAVLGIGPDRADVQVPRGRIAAEVLVGRAADGAGLRPFDPAGWTAIWGAVVAATAADVMADFGQRPAAALAQRYGQMLVRGASRVRARAAAPATVRYRAEADDLVIADRQTPYAGFFAVEEYGIGWRRFRGDICPPARRAVFISGDAVTVLPYDPVRDHVLLIEQFRVGPMARGDAQPWLLEPIAGRIDPGEGPEDAARREAVEEAGLTLGALIRVAGYYPTPGANSEYLTSYLAIADLPEGVTGTFGLASEAEDIRSHLVPFVALMAMVQSGEAGNAPLILTALWLQRERARLRSATGS